MTRNTQRWVSVVLHGPWCAWHSVLLILMIHDFWVLAHDAPRAAVWVNIRVLLLVQFALFAPMVFAVLWITWPHRTARKFVRWLSQGRCEEMGLRGVTKRNGDLLVNRRSRWELWQLDESSLVQEDRSPLDMLLGRLRFRIGKLPYEFVANRGRVVSFS